MGKDLVCQRLFTFVALTVAALLNTPRSHAQRSPTRPAFEVASIKLDDTCAGRHGRGGGFSPNGYSTSCVPLRVLIRIAYGKPAYGLANPRQMEVLGGPAWLDSEVYDVVAKGPGRASLDRTFDMIQTLLEDRCKLKVHMERREAPVYSLTVGKGGLKIQETKTGTCRPHSVGNLQPVERGAVESELLPCGWTSSTPSGGNVTKIGLGVTMDQLAGGMLASLDRPVINRTGLAGIFDVHLVYALDMTTPAQRRLDGASSPTPIPLTSDPTAPSVFSAIQQQLGLKLASDKVLVEVLVIDHVEKPSAN
jgi:uncharacterized protein (TIGR03435 family)